MLKRTQLKRKTALKARKPMKKRKKKDTRPKEEKTYFEWLKTQSCVKTNYHYLAVKVERAHVRRLRYGAGTSTKPPDWFCIPLWVDLHKELHKGEDTWEAAHGKQEIYLLKTWERYGMEKVPAWARQLVAEEMA